MFQTKPVVFAVGDEYQIMVPVTAASLMWVKVGEKCYYDDSNGILRSMTDIHRMHVPMSELNAAGKYTICEKKIIDRKPYFPETEPLTETQYIFRPVKGDIVRALFISDAHNDEIKTKKTIETFGDMDFFILGGDIPNHSGTPDNFGTIYRLCEYATGGNIPVVFARGNHDLRGYYAEKIADYTPNRNGNSYFTFRLGNIWGIVLDCGEDKEDWHAEYGGTVCCHSFREKQTEYLLSLIQDAESEYLAPGITHRIIVAHNPFTRQSEEPFNIEGEIYSHWAALLKEHIKPELMITGHIHEFKLYEVGGKYDQLGQPCPVISAAEKRDDYFAGGGFVFTPSGVEIYKVDSNGFTENIQ